jgi:tetratricopeptide (TPR) repeat protein
VAIADVHAAAALDTAALILLAEAIPYPTVALAAVSATVTRQITSAFPPDADPAKRATWLNKFGIALYQLGRTADALPVAQEAVAIHRELAAASPDRYRPGLAASLSGLGVTFAALGRPADALPAEQEAVAIQRELAAAGPDRHRADLAASLDRLAEILARLGRIADAEKIRRDAAS